MNEIQHFVGAERQMLDLLLDSEEGSLEFARINGDLMGIYERTGRSNRAVHFAEVEFKIVESYAGSNENILANPDVANDVANAYSDMGYSLCSAFRGTEALPYLDRAIEIAKSFPDPECYEKFNIDRFLRNHGRVCQQLGLLDKALADFEEAESYQAKKHGKNSHYDGE